MATRTAPSTPAAVTAQAMPSSAPTGKWMHPRFDEISKRLEASTFNDRNIKTILWRSLLLLTLFTLHQVNGFMSRYFHMDVILYFQSCFHPWMRLLIAWGTPVLFVAYTLLPLRPLFVTADDLSDIPLTPKQRSLLGLKQSSQPATPGSQYVTPPRYSRSATPRSGGSSQTDSPFSGRGSPLGSGTTPAFSPTASPLFQKAMGKETTRRLSYGSPSPLNLSRTINDSSSSLGSTTPASPLTAKGASAGLNNRWLYERGRRSSSNVRVAY